MASPSQRCAFGGVHEGPFAWDDGMLCGGELRVRGEELHGKVACGVDSHRGVGSCASHPELHACGSRGDWNGFRTGYGL